MKLMIVAVIVAILVIATKKLKEHKEQSECKELRETIHNSGIIKELNSYLRLLIEQDWSHKQIDYYDECDRIITVYNSSIAFGMWKDDDWQTMFGVDFVEDLGYKPLLDNGLKDGKKHITNEDIYRTFTYEVVAILKNLFNDDEIKYDSLATYSSGFENQKQPDGSYKRIKVNNECASIRYKVPKSIEAKQI